MDPATFHTRMGWSVGQAVRAIGISKARWRDLRHGRARLSESIRLRMLVLEAQKQQDWAQVAAYAAERIAAAGPDYGHGGYRHGRRAEGGVKVKRQWTPGPWHDAVTFECRKYKYMREDALVKKFGITVTEAYKVVAWTTATLRCGPCPVR